MTGDAGLALAYGLTFRDLHDEAGLARLDALWLAHLHEHDSALAERLLTARRAPEALEQRAESALLIELGRRLDPFIATLFGITEALERLREAHAELDPLFRVKWKFVKRQALLGVTPQELDGFDPVAARLRLLTAMALILGPAPLAEEVDAHALPALDELRLARAILAWQARPDEHTEALETARLYCAWAAGTDTGRQQHPDSVLFRHPEQLDPFDRLTQARTEPLESVQVTTIRPDQIRRRLSADRAPFALTDPGPTLRGALDESRYCLICHEQGRDSCSRGLSDSAASGPAGAGAAVRPSSPAAMVLKRSPFGEPLAGCPLGERISEFHALKREGAAVAALAMIVIDNPMVAATGHRICNDCVKACVYQKQTPVDIPAAETRTLRDVLELPWGVEIYALLTRWNPLNLRHPLPRPDSGRKVLVVGMGPAGFTLAHHLLNDGHTVVGIDGLKIEPAPWAEVEGGLMAPIRDLSVLTEPLETRITAGFGGVAEYGITVRWDKNFLAIIRLLLERRARFALFGGVRFGGTLSVEDAWQLGFDHIALAVGAGRPTTLTIPGGLARGVRTASDFLMSLQLTGAARTDSLANLQVRLPVVVIGGGLTAIDTATESLAAYVTQVDRFLARHEALVAADGEAATRANWTKEEQSLADELLDHGRQLRAERTAAQAEGREARLLERLQAWGGATVVCRKRLIDSPAYTLNPEEVAHALQEGIRIVECLAPRRFVTDEDGAVRAVEFARQVRRDDDDSVRWEEAADVAPLLMAARTVLIAAGTQPNTALAQDDPEHFLLDGQHFQAVDETGTPVHPVRGFARPETAEVLMSGRAGERRMSFFGDAHPSFAGNVVKAMASAARGWPVVSRALAARAASCDEPTHTFFARLNAALEARVVEIKRLAPGIVEVVIHAPAAAERFRPGQFYRLQNFERTAQRRQPPAGPATRLAMEGLALTGAWVDRAAGRVGLLVLEMGGSSNLCDRLEPGEAVVLMGPTGTPTDITSGETVVLVGGGLGNAVLFSIGAALRAAGCRVLYFAGYKLRADRCKVEEIEAAADIVVWCCDEAPGFVPTRAQDRAFLGNPIEALRAWGRDDGFVASPATSGGARPTETAAIRLQDADRLITIGSDRLMAAVAHARGGDLAARFKPSLTAIASVNAPMQCMMKGLCAQCLQVQIDPVSGAVRHVLSCVQQDQPMEAIDFQSLDQRLRQNSLQEKQTVRWLRYLTD